MSIIRVDAHVDVTPDGSGTILAWPDSAKVDWSWQPPLATAHGSDLAVMLTTQPHYTYVEGVGQVDRETGKPVVAPASEAPWPVEPVGTTMWEQERSLEQFQLASNRTNQIYLDGIDDKAKFGQPGTEPGVYYGRATGRLRLRDDALVPNAPYIPPPMVSGDAVVQVIDCGRAPNNSPHPSRGLRGIDTATFQWEVGATDFRLGLAEMINPTFRAVTIYNNDQRVADCGVGVDMVLVSGNDFPRPKLGDQMKLMATNQGVHSEPGDMILNITAV